MPGPMEGVRVIELGDAQVSDLPSTTAPDALIAAAEQEGHGT